MSVVFKPLVWASANTFLFDFSIKFLIVKKAEISGLFVEKVTDDKKNCLYTLFTSSKRVVECFGPLLTILSRFGLSFLPAIKDPKIIVIDMKYLSGNSSQ